MARTQEKKRHLGLWQRNACCRGLLLAEACGRRLFVAEDWGSRLGTGATSAHQTRRHSCELCDSGKRKKPSGGENCAVLVVR